MKEKSSVNGNYCFQSILRSGCWVPVRSRRQKSFKRLVARYQKEIDVTLAITVIGLMFLTGIWSFLVQLAEF